MVGVYGAAIEEGGLKILILGLLRQETDVASFSHDPFQLIDGSFTLCLE